LNEGASKAALEGMAPKTPLLTEENAKAGIIKSIQDRLEKIRDSGANPLFEKAKEIGAGNGIVDPTITLGKIDQLIARYSKQLTPNADRAVEVLQNIRERLQPSFVTQGTEGSQYVVRQGTPGLKTPSTQYVVKEGTPDITIPGAQPRMETRTRVVTEYDSLGMPRQRTVTEQYPVQGSAATTVSGTPSVIGTIFGSNVPATPTVMGNIPGAKPFEVQLPPRKLTVEEVQSVLSEFGKKASAGDNLIKDLSISDERIISSAIFGGMKDDFATALKTATGADKAALNLLNAAREKTANASQAYNKAISQGMPAFLQNKSLAEISPEDLYKTYMDLTPAQRGTMRSWVGKDNPTVLENLDQQVYTNFVNLAKKPNALGVETVDLATLAKNWRELGNVPGGQDALAAALGVKASEFGQRMKDAELFTRKMSVAQPATDQMFSPEQVRETQAAIGGTTNYGFAKLGQLTMDTLNNLTSKGLTDDQLMKVLLTPEGGQFLKSASLSPRSEQTLTDLMATDKSNLGKFGSWLGATAARTGPRLESAVQPTVEPTGPMQPSGQPDDLQLLLEEQALRQQQQNQ
jgi:hypothetical protein